MSSVEDKVGPSVEVSVRYHSLDALRAWMMLLGLVFHVTWLFQPEYFWNTRTDPQGHVGFQYFFGWVHVFRMQAFFVIAGFFAHLLVARRGVVSFLKNRCWRVLLPFVVSMIFLFPLNRWQDIRGGFETGRIQSSMSVWDYTVDHFRELPSKIGNQWPYHFWFLETLCLVYGIAILLWLAFEKVLDRDGKVRRRLQAAFDAIVGSAWCIPVLAVPVGGLLFWANSWFGIATGPLNPEWVGTLNYWFIFGVGWCLYANPELIARLSRHWRIKMLVGSVLALVLAEIFFSDWAEHRNRVGPTGAEMNLTVVADYPLLRKELLTGGESEIGEVRVAIRERLSPEYRKFFEEYQSPTTDQVFGLVDELNKKIVDSEDLATPERCRALGVVDHSVWGIWAARPIADRSVTARKQVNVALLHAAFSESLFPDRGRPLAATAVYFYAYGLTTWLLVNAWFGLFEEYFAGANAKVRYYSDSAYWLYLMHVTIQFEMTLWLGEYSWHPLLKCLVYLAGTMLVGVPSYHYLVRSTWIGHWLNGRRYERRPFLESALLPGRTDNDVTAG